MNIFPIVPIKRPRGCQPNSKRGAYKKTQKDKVENLYKSGWKPRDIAETLGMTTQNVYLYIKKYDLKRGE